MKKARTRATRVASAASRHRKTQVQPHRGDAGSEPTKILVPIDYSKPSLLALHTAANFARLYGGRITLLYVFEPPQWPRLSTYPSVMRLGIFITELGSRLTKLGRSRVDAAHFATALVRSGKPYEEIVKAAGDLKASLIIMGTHGYTGMNRVLLGSTAERVLRYAPCPVLTVQAEQAQRWP